MPKYNHMITIAFEVISEQELGEDITVDMLTTALLRRIASCIEKDELIAATGGPEDTYKIEEEE